MTNKNLLHYSILTIALIVFFGLFLFRLNEPWFGHREGAVVWIGATIRMYNQFGMDALSYLPTRTFGPANPEGVYYYLHHPPLTVWFSAWGTWLFGYNTETGAPYESSLRMVAILISMPTLCLMYVVAKRLTNRTSALIAFFLYTLTPMTLYFSRAPIFDFMVLPFVLAFAYIFIGWMQQYSMRGTVLLAIFAVLSIWVAWAGAFYLAALGVVALIYGNKQQRIGILLIGFVTGLATLAVPLLYEVLRPGAISRLVNIFMLRTSNQVAGTDSQSFTWLNFLAAWLKDLLTVVSLALSAFGIWGTGLLLLRRRDLQAAIMLAFVAGALVFMLIFRNAFIFHDWYEVAFMPGFAFAGAWAVYRAWLLPPNGLYRFLKPLIVAISVCSLGITVYWTIQMHQFTLNPFTRALAAELPLYTPEIPYAEGEAHLATNVSFPYDEVDYYAYRNIVWGVPLAEVEAYYAENDVVELDYFYCPEEGETFTGIFAELPYETIAGDCRLMHISKGQA